MTVNDAVKAALTVLFGWSMMYCLFIILDAMEGIR